MEVKKERAIELLAELAHDLLARWSALEYDNIVEYDGNVELHDEETERIFKRIDYLASIASGD